MKRANFLKLCFFVVLVIVNIYLPAQSPDSLLKKLDAEYPQEKLYLQFDRSLYNPGETIWFKAYLFSGIDLSLISKTMYTELLDEQGKLLQRKISPVLEATAASTFDLPVNL